jgi:hypothetical protein
MQWRYAQRILDTIIQLPKYQEKAAAVHLPVKENDCPGKTAQTQRQFIGQYISRLPDELHIQRLGEDWGYGFGKTDGLYRCTSPVLMKLLLKSTRCPIASVSSPEQTAGRPDWPGFMTATLTTTTPGQTIHPVPASRNGACTSGFTQTSTQPHSCVLGAKMAACF